VVGQFGLPQLAIREAAASISLHPPASAATVVRWFALAATAAASLICLTLLAVIWLLAPPFTAGRMDLVYYAAGLTFLLSLFGVGIGLLRGLGRNLTGQIIDNLARPAAVIAALLLLMFLGHRIGVGDAFLVQLAVVLAATLFIALALPRSRRAIGAPRKAYAPQDWLGVCLSFLSTNTLWVLNANYPLLVAGLFVSATDLGIFRVALSSAVLIALPSSIANIAVGPMVARLHHDRDAAGMKDTISHTTIACFATTGLAFLIILVAGRPLLGLLFGHEYIGAYVPLLILGATQLFVSAFGITGTFFNLTNGERLILRAFVWTVPLGLLVTVPLTAAFGIRGATIGNLCMVVAWHWFVLVRNRGLAAAPLSLFAALRHVRRQSPEAPSRR